MLRKIGLVLSLFFVVSMAHASVKPEAVGEDPKYLGQEPPRQKAKAL